MKRTWWQDAVIYQIYVRSFQDSDGDGIGDLPGIASRLEYLAWLGVDAVWLTPFYPSGHEDLGYDITDFRAVDPIHGTLDDFDALVAEAHRHGIRVIVDLVPNHTSHRHPWFVDARSSIDSSHRDWYFWRPSRTDGGPPNNWRGQTRPERGGAWVHDPHTDEWYLANFSPAQPELDWSNPEVRAAMAEVVEFWNGHGVDGYRVDMVDHLGKDPDLRDDEPGEDLHPRDRIAAARHQLDTARSREHVRTLRSHADTGRTRLLVGEVLYYLPIPRLAAWAEPGLLDLATNFRFTFLDFGPETLRSFVRDYDAALVEAGGWPNYCLGNHDSPRFTRLGANSRAAMTLLLTLRGTPFLYYGDELGMRDVDVPAHLRKDIWAENGRDRCRTPMQWTDRDGVGFCEPAVAPWLPAGDAADGTNVEHQRRDPSSMLALTRALIGLRRTWPAIRSGTQRVVDRPSESVLAYVREHESGNVLVAANLADRAADLGPVDGELLLDSYDHRRTTMPTRLHPGQAIVAALD